MNLEEKAIKEYGNDIHLWARQRDGFKAGYKQSIADITEFIRVNPKATHQAIIEYMEGIV